MDRKIPMENRNQGQKQTKIRRQSQKDQLDSLLIWLNRVKHLSTLLAAIAIIFLALEWFTPHPLRAPDAGSTLLLILVGAMILSIFGTLCLYVRWRILADRYKVSTVE
jgi:hypothetical protein